ncbi:hypothetical protein LTR53_015414 [Teratosphaeriaceae sp. CCFEE 6253]|nr:hypothetical protein LTR53_015414 [Teratosphaeriaceae sp. CCFEE 6253]
MPDLLINFRLCHAGVYNFTRHVPHDVECRTIQMPMYESTEAQKVNNPWAFYVKWLASKWAIPCDQIASVAWHRDDEDCDSKRPFADDICLGESRTMCMHFVTEWSAMVQLQPCGAHLHEGHVSKGGVKRGFKFVEGHKRRVTVSQPKRTEFDTQTLLRPLLNRLGIEVSDVEGFEYHLPGQDCSESNHLEGRLEPPGWETPWHVHMLVNNSAALAKLVPGEIRLASSVGGLAHGEQAEKSPSGLASSRTDSAAAMTGRTLAGKDP